MLIKLNFSNIYKNMTCSFCNDDEKKSRIFLENDFFYAMLGIQPIVIWHTLIIPKRCIKKIDELNNSEKIELFDFIDKVKNILQKTFSNDWFNYSWNEWSSAWQTVNHLHIHILPRKKWDNWIYEYEPRKFLYRPWSREKSPLKELIEINKIIKKNIS